MSGGLQCGGLAASLWHKRSHLHIQVRDKNVRKCCNQSEQIKIYNSIGLISFVHGL